MKINYLLGKLFKKKILSNLKFKTENAKLTNWIAESERKKNKSKSKRSNSNNNKKK